MGQKLPPSKTGRYWPGTWLALDDRFDERRFYSLWILATATYGVGDLVTTFTIFEYLPHVSEANPLVLAAVGAFGEAGFVALKFVTLASLVAVGARAGNAGDRFTYYAAPLTLIVVGTATTVYNLVLMLP